MTIRRIKISEAIEKGVPTDGKPWICDWRSFDIPETIAGTIRNAAPGLVAMTLSMMGGRQMIYAAEAAARERGIRILWWFGPGISDLSDVGQKRMRAHVKAARLDA